MNTCTSEKLDEFSKEHYTYINQIFGDETVREIIKEMYTVRDWDFAVEDANADFEYSNHHVLMKEGKTGEDIKWCSVDEGYQNIFVNKNDTLCQSYTLMKYLNKPIARGMKQRQTDMVRMYRNILKKEHFNDELEGMVEIMQKELKKKKRRKGVVLWKDYTTKRPTNMNKSYETIHEEINSVLDKWENYGYHYFMKEGTCPVKRGK